MEFKQSCVTVPVPPPNVREDAGVVVRLLRQVMVEEGEVVVAEAAVAAEAEGETPAARTSAGMRGADVGDVYQVYRCLNIVSVARMGTVVLTSPDVTRQDMKNAATGATIAATLALQLPVYLVPPTVAR